MFWIVHSLFNLVSSLLALEAIESVSELVTQRAATILYLISLLPYIGQTPKLLFLWRRAVSGSFFASILAEQLEKKKLCRGKIGTGTPYLKMYITAFGLGVEGLLNFCHFLLLPSDLADDR